MMVSFIETLPVGFDSRPQTDTSAVFSRDCGQGACIDSKQANGIIDLCSGMGGLSQAAQSLGGLICAGVDTNATAIRTFGKNFPDATAINGSVRSPKVLQECVEAVRVKTGADRPWAIISGPPCQGFSAAGSRDPSDLRNKVLVGVARAIVELKPRFALVENVSMLLAGKYGDRLAKFEEVLESSYYVNRLVLDSSTFGVAQKRRRAFFLVTQTKLDLKKFEAELELLKKDPVTVALVLAGLPVPEVRPDDYSDEKDYKGIANHFAMQHSVEVKRKIAAIDPGTGPMSYRRLHGERMANTLFSGHRAPPAHHEQARSITVREAARLQGFPDDFKIYGAFSNQMEQVTNAVPPPLARPVLQLLMQRYPIPAAPNVRSRS